MEEHAGCIMNGSLNINKTVG